MALVARLLACGLPIPRGNGIHPHLRRYPSELGMVAHAVSCPHRLHVDRPQAPQTHKTLIEPGKV